MIRTYTDNGKRKRSLAYSSWLHMRARCLDPRVRSYPYYGGRGITICDRWATSFSDFLSDMGEPPAGMTLDRINPDGNYERANCRWATRLEQTLNRRWFETRGESNGRARLTETQVREIRTKGKYATCREIAQDYGVSIGAIRKVLNGENWKHVKA